MSQATKRKHVVKEVLGDFVTPTENQQIVKVPALEPAHCMTWSCPDSPASVVVLGPLLEGPSLVSEALFALPSRVQHKPPKNRQEL